MLVLITNMVSDKLSIHPGWSQVKQKAQKCKPDYTLKMKEDITKQIEYKMVEVTQYHTWFANVVLVLKKKERSEYVSTKRILTNVYQRIIFCCQTFTF